MPTTWHSYGNLSWMMQNSNFQQTTDANNGGTVYSLYIIIFHILRLAQFYYYLQLNDVAAKAMLPQKKPPSTACDTDRRMWIIKLNRIFSFSSLFYCVHVFMSQTMMAMIWIFQGGAFLLHAHNINAICVQFIWVDGFGFGLSPISCDINNNTSKIFVDNSIWIWLKMILLIMKSNEWNIILCEKKSNDGG